MLDKRGNWQQPGAGPDANSDGAPATVVALRNVYKSYTSATGEVVEVLKGLNLEIRAGSFNVIRGESGSGKTSLLRILGMLDSDFEGDYIFLGADVKAKADWQRDELRANNIGFIFQEGRLFEHLSIRDNVSLPVRLQGTESERRALRQTVDAMAPRFFTVEELSNHILSNRPAQVSGGQKQRAAILRSVVTKPAIILADEPTASLDESRKQEILKLMMSLCDEGHTVIIVSHDKVFYQHGRQFELSGGVLKELAGDTHKSGVEIPLRAPANERAIFYGWRPRAPLSILLRQAMREAFLRPIFLFLVVVSLCVGVCQIGVFTSVILGAQGFLDDAMTRGSRLNRLEVKPRVNDLNLENRFPVIDTIKSWPNVQAIVPRRATLARLIDRGGEKLVTSALGLHPDDPEYRLLDFVAGGRFSPSNEELEIIATVGLLPDVFADADKLAEGQLKYADFIGRMITIELPQFSRTGQELTARARRIQLKVVGLILHAEGGRRMYLPNRTQLVFDRFKMDRDGSVNLPVNTTGDSWEGDRAEIARIAAFPWEDQLQVYTKEIRDIIPVFQQLSQLGYKPASDIWNYKWVLDLRDLAWNIFVPLLVLIVLAVSLTVATNLFSSAKLRETEFALWRVLGMRRGDLVATQVVSTALMVLCGTLVGLAIASTLIDSARGFLAEQNPDAGFEAVFAPIGQFFVVIIVCSVVVGVLAAIYPAVKTAHSDPAKVLQS